MELKFIWIDQYRVIENLGINFNHSDQHQFRYESNILHLLPNPISPVGFGPKITGITAIAGENGSGKSSLCETVLLSTATYTNGSFGYNQLFKGIVCYGDHIFIQKDIQVSNKKKLKKSGYTIVTFEESPFEDMKHEWRDSFMKGGFIYYSNVLDYRAAISEVNLANISTISSLDNSYNYSTSKREQPDRINAFHLGYSPDEHGSLQTHFNVEGNRIVRFYLEHAELVEFIPVRDFVIKCTYSGNNRWLDRTFLWNENKRGAHSISDIQAVENIEQHIFNKLIERRSDQKQDVKIVEASTIKLAIKALYRYNLIISLTIARNELPDANELWEFVFNNGVVPTRKTKSKIQELCRLHEEIVDRSTATEDIEISPSSVENYYKGRVSDWRFFLVENYRIRNMPENRTLLYEFLILEEKILVAEGAPYRRITNYNVAQLSGGESSLLTLFARLNDVLRRYANSPYDKKEKLILFIDEGEVGFHPAWKRKYFELLLNFLNGNVYTYKYQVIITTHSPYLLSDLPTVNTVLLKKNADGKTALVDIADYQTFGANINDLLSTSFFLEEGLIGAFATKKIQLLIDNLQIVADVKPAIIMTKKEIGAMIELIAEPFLQQKLWEMYYEKYPKDRQARIEQLKYQIKRLEND